MQCKSLRGSAEPNTIHRTMKISLDHVPFSPLKEQQQLIAILPSPLDYGFAASEKYPDDAKIVKLPSVFPLKTRPEGWKAVLDLPWSWQSSTAALMFKNADTEAFVVILYANESGVCGDIVVPHGTETLAHIMRKRFCRSFVDRSIGQLHSRLMVCATSRRKIFMNYETVYFVNIVINPIDIEMAD